ncbi:uncharacterized protein [Lolium perenne]|uniref:uncharacterized protein n=1 Tax=Lolium perenne TaxID=4522 RepID=UPI0021F6468B|nr:protein PLASTID MOVEMENT IMPAIRED 2-like [Lolium perenne]
MEKAKIMEQRYGGNDSVSVGDGMSIFGGQSIDVRRRSKLRRRATHKNVSYDVVDVARVSLDWMHPRPVTPEKEMAKKLERQVDVKAARPRRPELQGTRGSGRRANGLVVDVEGAPGDGATPRQSSGGASYADVMQELDRVRRELRELQREVKAAREGGTPLVPVSASPSSTTTSSGSVVAGNVKERDAGEAHEVPAAVEVAGAGRETEEATRRTARAMVPRQGATRGRASVSSEVEAWLTAGSSESESDEGHEYSSSLGSVAVARRHGHEVHDGWPPLQAAEAELDMARAELESFKEESQSLQFTAPMLRARAEMERIAEEMGRLEGQEKKAGAQVRQLDAVLGDAKSRLAAVTAADEMAGEILSDLKAALRRVDEETEAAEKERALTELENGCAVADAESVAAEIAAAEKRIRAAVRELEAARAGEAAATGKLREVVESERWARASTVSQRSGNVTIPRFEYEYLAGRAEVVRAVADKKVAAAEAWVEARRAGEKEMIMRAEAIERELGEDDGVAVAQAVNDDEEQQRPREGLQRAPSTRPVRATGSSAVTSRRKTMAAVLSTSSSPMHRNPRAPPSIRVENKKMRVLIPNYLKLISGKFTGRK